MAIVCRDSYFSSSAQFPRCFVNTALTTRFSNPTLIIVASIKKAACLRCVPGSHRRPTQAQTPAPAE
eukprot:scaffold53220_cov37-Prasinocladus_malaysianus.AAC.1